MTALPPSQLSVSNHPFSLTRHYVGVRPMPMMYYFELVCKCLNAWVNQLPISVMLGPSCPGHNDNALMHAGASPHFVSNACTVVVF